MTAPAPGVWGSFPGAVMPLPDRVVGDQAKLYDAGPSVAAIMKRRTAHSVESSTISAVVTMCLLKKVVMGVLVSFLLSVFWVRRLMRRYGEIYGAGGRSHSRHMVQQLPFAFAA